MCFQGKREELDVKYFSRAGCCKLPTSLDESGVLAQSTLPEHEGGLLSQ